MDLPSIYHACSPRLDSHRSLPPRYSPSSGKHDMRLLKPLHPTTLNLETRHRQPSCTQNPKPKTQNPKPQTQNHKPPTQNPNLKNPINIRLWIPNDIDKKTRTAGKNEGFQRNPKKCIKGMDHQMFFDIGVYGVPERCLPLFSFECVWG